MVFGVPRMCINTYGTCRSATASYISSQPPEMSLMMSASYSSTALRATSARKVSTDTTASGKRCRIALSANATRRHSSASLTSDAPGRVE